ncbi:hypothetical protein [Geobacter argillaceus]|uniref:Uncharacterized protein n=1 Tax=Geobacter argillaceus TaxID=345631 RepID=A0A562VPS9_9BACT|nr:hypothetical protein [Geobacter argillaceus]TWJ19727.1 hypothetical protein JN12_01528 [Geobacter argillaceus]
MKRIARIIPILTLLVMVAAPLTVYAAGKKAKSEVVMKMGNKVHLFHSSNVEAQKEIAVGDVLPVYRLSGKAQQQKEVGQVKVIGFMGEHYFEAEIVKGEIKVGDIAKKENSALLVQPAK